MSKIDHAVHRGCDELGLSDSDVDHIRDWTTELNGPCDRQREEELAENLVAALAGFMVVEPELLLSTILAEVQRRKLPALRTMPERSPASLSPDVFNEPSYRHQQ